MSQIEDAMGEPADFEAGRTLWRRCRTTDMVEDAGEHFLDLAALADGMIEDDDEHDRVAALVAGDPVAMSDVAAGRAISTGGIAMPSGLDRVIERAVAIVDAPERKPAPPPARAAPGRRVLQGMAQWGGLAAALAFASWFGFAMGSGASLSLSQPGQPSQLSDGNFLPEVLDPPTGFLRDLGEGQQT